MSQAGEVGRGVMEVVSAVVGLAILGLLLRRASDVTKISSGLTSNLQSLLKTASMT